MDVYASYNIADPTLRCSDFIYMDLVKNYPNNSYYVLLIDYNYNQLYNESVGKYEEAYKSHYGEAYSFNTVDPEISIIKDSIVFSDCLFYLMKNGVTLDNCTILDTGVLERLYFIDDVDSLETLVSYIGDNKMFTGNKNFHDALVTLFKDMDVYHSDIKMDFSRLDNIEPPTNNNVMSALENEKSFAEITALLENDVLDFDKMYLSDRLLNMLDMTNRESLDIYKFIKFEKRIELIKSKYLQSNIEACNTYAYFRYDGDYSFMVRSVWEFFYTGRNMYWLRNPEDKIELDGFNYYLKKCFNDSSEYSNKLVTVDKDLVLEHMQLDKDKYFYGSFLK